MDGIGLAAALIELNVGPTGLAGPFPSKEFDKLYKLESFSCSNNKRTGTLPDLKCSLRLMSLQIASNRLLGPLFGYHSLVRIKIFDLSGNSLMATVPKNFLGGVWEVASPLFVNLIDNDLVRPVPSLLQRFLSLLLRLERNKFEIAVCVCIFDDGGSGKVVTACKPCQWAKYWAPWAAWTRRQKRQQRRQWQGRLRPNMQDRVMTGPLPSLHPLLLSPKALKSRKRIGRR